MGIANIEGGGKREGKRGEQGQLCPLCGGRNMRRVYTHSTGLPLVRCPNCGLMFFLFPEEAHGQFPEYWRTGGSRNNLEVYANPRVIEATERTYSRYLDWLGNELGVGKLIDYGCGIGTFVRLAQERGWQTYGLDISEVPVKYAQKKDLPAWTIEQWYAEKQGQREKEKVDVVTMFDVIEHLENPAQTVQKLSSLLRDEGILLVETPSASYFFKQLSLWLAQLSRGKIDIASYFFYPDHRFYFTRKTLTRLLSDCGFQVMWDKGNTTPAAKIIHKLRKVHRAGRLTQGIAWLILQTTKLLGGNKLVMCAVKDKSDRS
jgi:2-polyprenyl-3-methyl-5-hydroxy-6-metoxy-1,4-benzoquinol methylase